MEHLTLVEREYHISLPKFVIFVLPLIHGPIPKAVATADAHNGRLSRLGSTQVLETTMRNAEDIIHGTAEQRRAAQESLSELEAENHDITRQDIRDHRTIVPEPNVTLCPSSSCNEVVNDADPAMERIRLEHATAQAKAEAELYKKETVAIKKAMDDNLRKERDENRKIKSKSSEYIHLQDLEAIREREKVLYEKERAKSERCIQIQETKKAEQETKKAEQETLKLEMVKEVEQTKRAEIEQTEIREKAETDRLVRLKQMDHDHELKMKELQGPSQKRTRAPEPSMPKTIQVSSVAQTLQHLVPNLIVPSNTYGAKIDGEKLAFHALCASITARKNGQIAMFPSINFIKFEFDMKHWCAELKRVLQDKNYQLHIPDRPVQEVSYDDETGLPTRLNRIETSFSLIGYELRNPRLYSGELKIECLGNAMGYEFEVERCPLSGFVTNFTLLSRPAFDVTWGQTLSQWHQNYLANPPSPPRKIRRLSFRGLTTSSSIEEPTDV